MTPESVVNWGGVLFLLILGGSVASLVAAFAYDAWKCVIEDHKDGRR